MTTRSEAQPVHLAVVMEGGLVQSIVSDTELPNLNVVIDYHTKGSNPEDRVSVPQADGRLAEARSSFYNIDAATIDLAAVIQQLMKVQEAQP